MPLSLDAPEKAQNERLQVVDGVMTMPRKLDSRFAPALMESLLEARGQTLQLSLSEAELLGMQCAIVLVSAAKTWHADGNSLTVSEPSEQFEQDLGLLGFQLEDISAP